MKRVVFNVATHGIEIQDQVLESQNKLSGRSENPNDLKLTPNIDISIWDFGGGGWDYYDPYYNDFSIRSVFLVLWKMKDGKNRLDLNFWFKLLSFHLQHDSTSLANNKPYFSILVVGTFLDNENVDKSEESKKLREQEILEIAKSNRIHYPIQIYEVSCSTMENIDELKQEIYKTILTHGYMGENLPLGYLNIEKSIKELKKQEIFNSLPIIDIQELIRYFKATSKSEFKFDLEFVKRGLKLLHQWETCIYFDEPKELSNYIILKQKFVIKDVLKEFLIKRDLCHNIKDGILKHSDLKLFWPNYLCQEEMLVAFMEKFDICFKMKEDEGKPFKDQRSLILHFLSKDEPKDLSKYWPNEFSNKNEEIERRIIFNRFPKEIINRLFIYLHQNAENELVWEYGMFITSKENKKIKALLTVIDPNSPQNLDQFNIRYQITIKVRGEDFKKRKEVMDNIIEEIWKCSKKYSGIVGYQMVSSPFDSTPSGLIKLSDCLLEITKPKDKQEMTCPTTKNIINPIDLLLKSGMIYQSQIIEEKKKEIQDLINKLKKENNLNEDQIQELLHHPQLTSILMTEILEHENQDSNNRIESRIKEDNSSSVSSVWSLNIPKPKVFLTHTWVKDELNRDNHDRVRTVNKLLQAQGFNTWFDNDKLVGHITTMMAEGIDDSDIILAFVTKAYMEKVASKGHDNCKGEFTYATNMEKKMIPIVMEPCMRVTKQWKGPLGIVFGGNLYVDMSGTGSENDITILINHLERISTMD